MKAAFFDRDGTLIVNKHYLSSPTGIRFQPCAFELLRHLLRLSYKIFIVTNQSGVRRGFYSRERVDEINREMLLRLNQEKVHVTEVVYCPHHPKERCPCRKPQNLLLKELVRRYNIDTAKSFVIGDRVEDVLLGKSLNIKTILLTNELTTLSERPDFFVSSLCEIFKIING
ncbi:MAG: HAD family hydrolase [candidate division WOR-3 bacterium]